MLQKFIERISNHTFLAFFFEENFSPYYITDGDYVLTCHGWGAVSFAEDVSGQ